MVKPVVTVNPKHTVIRKALTKMRPELVRGLGTLARVQVTTSAAQAELTKLETQLTGSLKYIFGSTGAPLVEHTETLPETQTAWVYQALSGRRNALHGNLCSGVVVGFVQEGKLACLGLMLADGADLTLSAAGEGTMGPDGRVRVSSRELKDSFVQLPMNSGDAHKLALLTKADELGFHTRKSGNMLADALLVAEGKADALVATRLSAFEKLAIELLVKEAGGTTKSITTAAGDTLVAGNLKIVVELSAILQ